MLRTSKTRKLAQANEAARALIAATQADSIEQREVVVHLGVQTARVPVRFLVGYFAKSLRDIEEWKKTADPLGLTLYTGIKQSLNIMIPLLRQFIKLRMPEFPQMPERPRHTDPVVFLMGYVNGLAIDLLSRGEFILPVDEAGAVTDFEWTYLDELETLLETLPERRKTLTIAPADEAAEEGEV